jgi:hypothetical protein
MIDAWADDHDGVVDDLPPEIVDCIDKSAKSIEEKVDRIVSVIHEYDARYNARRQAAQALLTAARADDAKAKSLKDYLRHCMSVAGAKHWAGGLHEVRVVTTGGKRQVDIQVGVHDLPIAYQRVVVEADTDAIREDLEAGKPITGCALKERGTHLRIK